MTAFEYLSVLLSIILGLAITQILQGYRSILLSRKRVQNHWPALIWSVLVLLFAAQAWWVSFGLEDRAEWRFDTFLVILLQMGLIYMMAALILPDIPDGSNADLALHYEAQRRPFFACLALVVMVSLAKDLLLEGRLPGTFNLSFHAFLLVVAALGYLMQKRSLQLALALLMVFAFAAYVATLFSNL